MSKRKLVVFIFQCDLQILGFADVCEGDRVGQLWVGYRFLR
jgi:hypothetical protein